jgi:hypothetical protein
MADSGIQEIRSAAGESGALPFRFEVSWRSLTHSAEPSPAPMSKNSGGSIATSLPPGEVLKEWQSALAFAKSPSTFEVSPNEPASQLVQAPVFGMAANIASPPKWKIPLIFGLLAAFALAAAMTIGRGSPSHDAGPTMTTNMGEAGWENEWVSDRKGSALGRQISLYRPSIGIADYRLEFTGRIGLNSLGWVFRAADTKNYYVGKVSESAGRLALTRFAVIRGVEGPRTRLILPLLPGAGPLRVKLDARGSRFTIYLQNEVVDDWQDERLMTGGVGFLNEREERGQVDSVQISFPKGVSGHE